LKKRIIGIICVLSILVISACSKADEEIVGVWEDNLLGLANYEFKKDGKFTIDVDDELIEGKYKMKGDTLTLTVDDETRKVKYSIEDDILTLTPENEDPVEFVRVTKDKGAVSTNTEPEEEEPIEEEDDEVEEDSGPYVEYLYHEFELKKHEEVIFENEAGRISTIGYGMFEEKDSEGEMGMVARVALKVEGELQETLKETKFNLSGIFTGGIQEDFSLDYTYEDKGSTTLIFVNDLYYVEDPNAELLRLDYSFLRTDIYVSDEDKDKIEVQNILFDNSSNGTVVVGGVERLPFGVFAPEITMEDEDKTVDITGVFVEVDTSTKVKINGDITFLNEDRIVNEVMVLNIPSTGKSAFVKLEGEYFKGIPTPFEATFIFKNGIEMEENISEFYVLGLGTEIRLSNDNNRLSDILPINKHALIYENDAYDDVLGDFNSPSIYGTKDTAGNLFFQNTMIFAPNFYGDFDGYEERYKNEEITIPLGKRFKEFKVTLSMIEGLLKYENVDVPGTKNELVVEFYESVYFPTRRGTVYNKQEPIKTVVIKPGDQPQDISIDVSNLNGLFVWVKSPLVTDFDAFIEGRIEAYELIFKDGILIRK